MATGLQISSNDRCSNPPDPTEFQSRVSTYRFYWLLAAAGIAVLFAFQPDWSQWHGDEPVPVTEPANDARSARLAIQGLQLISLEHGQLALGLDAELFWVRPRKFLFYTASEENELYVEGARLQIHLLPDDALVHAADLGEVPRLRDALPETHQTSGAVLEPRSVPPARSVSPLLSEIGLAQILNGFPEVDGVTRINAKGITVEVFRGMRRVLLLSAESAVSDIASRGMRLNQVRVEQPGSARVLTASVALWSGPQRRLLLPDGYEQSGPWGTDHGGPASLDINFQIHYE